MIAFIIWLALLAAVIAAICWFNVPTVVMVVVAGVAATVRLHLKFIAAWWLMLTTRR
ncbi:hypothetical protein [Glutamicibacter arilaitensis]|uniref:hypothetical protein n=1 Tax=Glutamicibacter arilaitensis TaxID=256701 RepID=UPI003F8FF169